MDRKMQESGSFEIIPSIFGYAPEKSRTVQFFLDLNPRCAFEGQEAASAGGLFNDGAVILSPEMLAVGSGPLDPASFKHNGGNRMFVGIQSRGCRPEKLRQKLCALGRLIWQIHLVYLLPVHGNIQWFTCKCIICYIFVACGTDSLLCFILLCTEQPHFLKIFSWFLLLFVKMN